MRKLSGGFNGERTKRPRGAAGYHGAPNFAAFNFFTKNSIYLQKIEATFGEVVEDGHTLPISMKVRYVIKDDILKRSFL